MSKKVWKIIGLSSVVLIIIVMVGANYIKNSLSQADEILKDIEQEKVIREELQIDAEQVFGVLELAYEEQRELTVDEQMLVNEFDAKYMGRDDLTSSEIILVSNLLLMSRETIPSSQLKSEAGRYEEYREETLEYLER